MKRRFLRTLAAAVSSRSRWPDPRQPQTSRFSTSPTIRRGALQAYDDAFAAYWKERQAIPSRSSSRMGGSGAQARAVIDGLAADVVTLALEDDINKIAGKGLISKDWKAKLPDNSTPYTSTIVFLVRRETRRASRTGLTSSRTACR